MRMPDRGALGEAMDMARPPPKGPGALYGRGDRKGVSWERTCILDPERDCPGMRRAEEVAGDVKALDRRVASGMACWPFADKLVQQVR